MLGLQPSPVNSNMLAPCNVQGYCCCWAAGGGLVQLFALNSDCSEPDGTSSDSKQGRWLQDQLAASRATWKFVMLHHSPYSSGGEHGSHARLQWPFEEWGADAVLSVSVDNNWGARYHNSWDCTVASVLVLLLLTHSL